MNRNTIKTDFALKATKGKARIVLLTLALLIGMIAASSIAFAGEVSYEGQSKGFVFTPGSDSSPTDLFENFDGVMPGDTLAETIDVVNKGSREASIYMRALSPDSGADFLSQMNLKVTKASSDEIFDAAADQTAGLTDWVLLGKLAPQSRVTLTVALNIPITMGNDYQNAVGSVNWEFKAEEQEDPSTPETTTPKSTQADDPGDPDGGKSSRTGDEARIAIFVLLLLAAGTGIVLVHRRRRKA